MLPSNTPRPRWPSTLAAVVTGQARDDPHLMGGEERGQVVEPGLEQDGEIAAVDDLAVAAARLDNQPPEAGVHLRRAPGEIDDLEARIQVEQFDQPRGDSVAHDVGLAGAGLDVAMMAGEVAEAPHVHL